MKNVVNTMQGMRFPVIEFEKILTAKLKNVKSYFIKRCENEYITAIQEREYYNHKKLKNSQQLVIGDVVLVNEGNFPRMSWRKGRIINVIRGVDKLIR